MIVIHLIARLNFGGTSKYLISLNKGLNNSGFKSIVVTGYVSSMANMLNKATVAIAPMQSGSGMQIKILEAMASSVPVITTTIGLGDLKAVVDKDLFIADEPLDFSQQILKLLKSKNQNRALGKNGRKYVSLNHDFNILNKRFTNICGFKKIRKNIIIKAI